MGKIDQGVATSEGRYTVIPRVLVFVFNAGDVLLIKGAPTKRIWANRYNGIGGHVEADEDVYAAALREIHEETGLAVRALRFCGTINIDAGGETGIMIFVFAAHSEGRETIPSPEGSLEWVPLHRIGAYDLVEDIPVLLDRVQGVSGGRAPFFARYWYDEHDALRMAFWGDIA
jgi:8-oxo-dGTP diphosphatase